MQVSATFELKGHRDSVLCLDAGTRPTNQHMLLSGSEDETVRVWDLNKQKAVRCVKAFGQNHAEPEITNVRFSPHSDDIIYASVESKVYVIDMRVNKSVVITQPSIAMEYNADEIGFLLTNAKGNYMAACDDEGEVQIIDIKREYRRAKTLRNAHSNICSACVFPSSRPSTLISGGTDCQVIAWDFRKGKVLCAADTRDCVPASNRMLNPPFVYSLSGSSDGRTVAAGLGDGQIALYSTDGLELTGNVTGHNSCVAHLEFVRYGAGDTKDQRLADCLVSVSNDPSVVIWRLATAGVGVDGKTGADQEAQASLHGRNNDESGSSSNTSRHSNTKGSNRRGKHKRKKNNKKRKGSRSNGNNYSNNHHNINHSNNDDNINDNGVRNTNDNDNVDRSKNDTHNQGQSTHGAIRNTVNEASGMEIKHDTQDTDTAPSPSPSPVPVSVFSKTPSFLTPKEHAYMDGHLMALKFNIPRKANWLTTSAFRMTSLASASASPTSVSPASALDALSSSVATLSLAPSPLSAMPKHHFTVFIADTSPVISCYSVSSFDRNM